MPAIPTTLRAFGAMIAVPGACAVTRPLLLTEAMASLDDDPANLGSTTVAPLEVTALARSCTPPPTSSVSTVGVIWTVRMSGAPSGWAVAAVAGGAFASRSASSRLAATHLLTLSKPTPADRTDRIPQKALDASAWPGFWYWSAFADMEAALARFSPPHTRSTMGPVLEWVQRNSFRCSLSAGGPCVNSRPQAPSANGRSRRTNVSGYSDPERFPRSVSIGSPR